MEEKKKFNFSFWDIISVLLLIFVVCYELFRFHVTDNAVLQPLWDMTLTRLAAGSFFLILLLRRGFRPVISAGKAQVLACISILPCVLLVVNNLPLLSLIKGDAYLTYGFGYILVFALQCLSIGFFEEIAFRGLFFLLALKKFHASRIQVLATVVISSAVFGMYHLFNLFEGSAPGPVFLQIGYSTLIGAMCAVVLLKTGNIIVCVLLHAVYDFCGTLVPTLGGGTWWDTPTVIFTAILAVIVFVYMLVLFLRMDLSKLDKFYERT